MVASLIWEYIITDIISEFSRCVFWGGRDGAESRYKKQFKIEKEKKVYEISNEEKVELKKKFRKATFLCHPDKVADEFSSAAHTLFIQIKEAYDANDLKRLDDILSELESGCNFKSKSETTSEKGRLKAAILELKNRIKIIEHDILEIKQSETYVTIQKIEDWNFYFSRTKEQLSKELEELKGN